jgi:teichuronic acid biosynthesis glycosyltransferase TuaC
MPLISVITPLFPIAEEPYRGRAIYNTVVALQRHADVEVYCPLRVYPAFLEPRRHRYHRPDMSYRPAGVERIRYVECPAIPIVSRPFNGLLCARLLYPFLERSRPDLILNYWVYPEGYAAVRLGRRLAKPVIVSSRGSDLLRIGDGVTRHLVKTTVKAADRVLTVSRQLRDRAVEWGADPQRTRVIPNGCDREVFDYRDREEPRRLLGVSADEKVIVFAGWLDASKGMRELLEAFRVVSVDPKTTLVCIGEGKMAAAIRVFAGQHQLQTRIRLEGKRSASEVAQWMNAGDVFCLPSHSEGCPNVVVEAISCGCPVVATDVGGIPDLISGKHGILVPPRDAGKLAEALQTALARSWDRKEISRQSQRGWEQVAAETFAVCEELLRP